MQDRLWPGQHQTGAVPTSPAPMSICTPSNSPAVPRARCCRRSSNVRHAHHRRCVQYLGGIALAVGPSRRCGPELDDQQSSRRRQRSRRGCRRLPRPRNWRHATSIPVTSRPDPERLRRHPGSDRRDEQLLGLDCGGTREIVRDDTQWQEFADVYVRDKHELGLRDSFEHEESKRWRR